MKFRKLIAVFIIFVLVIEIPCIDNKRAEVYAAFVPAIPIATETVWSLIFTGLVGTGIYDIATGADHTLTIDEKAHQITEEEKALIRKMYEDGAFESNDMEGLIQYALSDTNKALDRFKIPDSLKDEITAVGSAGEVSKNGTVNGLLAVTSNGIKKIVSLLKNGLDNFALKKAVEYSGGVTISAFPNEWSKYYGKYGNYQHYFVFEKSGVCYLYLLEGLRSPYKGGDRLYSNYGTPSVACLHCCCWTYDVNTKTYSSVNDATRGTFSDEWYIDISDAKILYSTFDIYNTSGQLIFSAKPIDTSESSTDQTFTRKELEDAVNRALEEAGYKSRYSVSVAEQCEDIYSGVNAQIHDVAVPNTMVVGSNPVDVVKNINLPVAESIATTGIASLDIPDITSKVGVGAQAITDSVASAISDSEIEEMAKTKISGVLGSLNQYEIKGLKDVFPFCIPFDLIDFIKILAAEPKAPVINWVIPLSSFGLQDYAIHIDLSLFEPVARVIRTMELLGGILGLISITRHIIKG